ncbi:MAG: NUDIX domain-containing protein [Chlamydiae bacterium]|nr:NUDIX domain-containing protein [Chlamydiota bacterium]
MQKFHLGIYALIEQDGKVLLVKKSRGPYEGMWDLPGGRPIHGETILETLSREVLEETGIEILQANAMINGAFVVDYLDQSSPISLHHTCLIYRATHFDTSKFESTISLEDVAGSFWFKKSQLEDLPLSKVVCLALGRPI